MKTEIQTKRKNVAFKKVDSFSQLLAQYNKNTKSDTY